MQVTLDKDSPIFLAATMAFTDPSLRKSHQAFNRSISSAWEYVPKPDNYNTIMDGLKTQLTEGPGLWFSFCMDQEVQKDRNKNSETHTWADPLTALYCGIVSPCIVALYLLV